MKAITENIIRYKLGLPPMNIVMVGVFFITIGVSLSMQLWIFKFLLLLGGLGIIISRDRLAIDFEHRRIMKYVWMLGFRLGKWEKIENAKYIALVRVRMSRKENLLTISTTRSKVLVKANLIFSRNHYITLFKQPANKALPMIKTIATGFELDIYDMTHRNKKKIMPNVLHGDFLS